MAGAVPLEEHHHGGQRVLEDASRQLGDELRTPGSDATNELEGHQAALPHLHADLLVQRLRELARDLDEVLLREVDRPRDAQTAQDLALGVGADRVALEVLQRVVLDHVHGHVVVAHALGQAQHDVFDKHPDKDQPLDGHSHLEQQVDQEASGAPSSTQGAPVRVHRDRARARKGQEDLATGHEVAAVVVDLHQGDPDADVEVQHEGEHRQEQEPFRGERHLVEGVGPHHPSAPPPELRRDLRPHPDPSDHHRDLRRAEDAVPAQQARHEEIDRHPGQEVYEEPAPEVVLDDLRPLHHAPVVLVPVARREVYDEVGEEEQGDDEHNYRHADAFPAQDHLVGEHEELEGAEEAPGDVPEDAPGPLRRQEPAGEAEAGGQVLLLLLLQLGPGLVRPDGLPLGDRP
mmetsp:Transcript_26773/g.79849  ORF Transcript_26773/g.79849 Transcript_26773/m.79849 type:complete len:403 (-) Transcript_26773:206-1414(-)